MAVGETFLGILRLVITSGDVLEAPAVDAVASRPLDGDNVTIREVQSGKIGGTFTVNGAAFALSENRGAVRAVVTLRAADASIVATHRSPSTVSGPPRSGARLAELRLDDAGIGARGGRTARAIIAWAQTYLTETA